MKQFIKRKGNRFALLTMLSVIPITASANGYMVSQLITKPLSQKTLDTNDEIYMPPYNDGFLQAISFRDGPKLRFCYKSRYSLKEKSCFTGSRKDAVDKSNHTESVTAQELLDLTFGKGVTRPIGYGPYRKGATIFYQILESVDN